MSRTYKILLVAIVAVLAGGGYWKLVSRPSASRPPSSTSTSPWPRPRSRRPRRSSTTYGGAQNAYKANYATVVRLGKAVPTDDDTRSLLVQLDAAAKRAGVDFDTSTSTAAAAAPPPDRRGSGRPGRGQRRRVLGDAVQLHLQRQFSTLGDFFARLERFVTFKATRSRSAAACCASRASRCPGRGRLAGAGRHRSAPAPTSSPRRPRPRRRGRRHHHGDHGATTTTTTTTERARD